MSEFTDSKNGVKYIFMTIGKERHELCEERVHLLRIVGSGLHGEMPFSSRLQFDMQFDVSGSLQHPESLAVIPWNRALVPLEMLLGDDDCVLRMGLAVDQTVDHGHKHNDDDKAPCLRENGIGGECGQHESGPHIPALSADVRGLFGSSPLEEDAGTLCICVQILLFYRIFDVFPIGGSCGNTIIGSYIKMNILAY